jgi:hypothetical protein
MEPREVDFEVLPKNPPPPRRTPGTADPSADPLVALIARIMDSIFTIPGTKVKFGLDPLIGLIPGFGSGASAFVSLLLIARSATHGVPNHILARMTLNVLINAILDAVPVVGDALSIFYRSNAKNYELLQRHAGTRKKATARDWLFLAALFFGVGLLVFCLLLGIATLLAHIVMALSPR